MPEFRTYAEMIAEANYPATEGTYAALAERLQGQRDEARGELERLRERHVCITEGRRYPDCNGDCGEREMYCCDGGWDFWRTAAERDRYADALREIVAIGGTPRDSMLSDAHQYRDRGQAMMNAANRALNA